MATPKAQTTGYRIDWVVRDDDGFIIQTTPEERQFTDYWEAYDWAERTVEECGGSVTVLIDGETRTVPQFYCINPAMANASA